MKRDSFIIYASFYEPISGLTNEQLGRLFRALFLWRITGEEKVEPDILMAFKFFIHQIVIDDERYLKKCNQNRHNIEKRWDKNDTPVYDGIQPNTNNTYKEKDNPNDNPNGNVFNVGADAPKPTKRTLFVSPTLEEVQAYALEVGAPERESSAFYDYHSASGWILSGGRKMRDWKASFRYWIRNSHQFNNSPRASTKSRTEIPHAEPGEFKDTLM